MKFSKYFKHWRFLCFWISGHCSVNKQILKNCFSKKPPSPLNNLSSRGLFVKIGAFLQSEKELQKWKKYLSQNITSFASPGTKKLKQLSGYSGRVANGSKPVETELNIIII